MPATPTGPDPSNPAAISEEVDRIEERVVGRRVNPPRSDDLDEPDGAADGPDAEDHIDGGEGGSEPTD